MKQFQRKIITLTASILLAGFSLSPLAQHVGGNLGPCPGGSAPVNGSCGSPSNAQGGSIASAPEIWRDRYGAIASAKDIGVVGFSNSQKSARSARKAAIRKCGDPACKIVSEYVNSCGSVAFGQKGDGGVAKYSWGSAPEESEAKALAGCMGSGGSFCKIEHTSCSLPVRVQ